MGTKHRQQAGIAAAAIVLIILVLGIAGFAAYKVTQKKPAAAANSPSVTTPSPAPSNDDAKANSPSSKAADFRSGLVRLAEVHMVLTDTAVDQTLDTSPSASASTAALLQNGKDIAAVIGTYYGKDAESSFTKIWQVHLEDLIKYAGASAKADAAGKAAALKDIDDNYTKPLAAFLAKANPNLDEKIMAASLGDHVTMSAAVIDAHVAKDYTGEYNKLGDASKHIEGVFSMLSAAIVKQYPAKFE